MHASFPSPLPAIFAATTADFVNYGLYGLVLMWLIGTHLKEGLWGTSILFVNAMLSSQVAMVVASLLTKVPTLQPPSDSIYLQALATYSLRAVPMWIFLYLGILFSNKLSKIRVKFPQALDVGGGTLCLLGTLEALFLALPKRGPVVELFLKMVG